MSCAFWCSACKVTHAGECPPPPRKSLVQRMVEACDGTASEEDLDELKAKYLKAKDDLFRAMNIPPLK